MTIKLAKFDFNKNFLNNQIGDGGRSLHEVEKQCRRLEEEKEEMANALDEAEVALEQVSYVKDLCSICFQFSFPHFTDYYFCFQ